jgi:hypothetical protein
MNIYKLTGSERAEFAGAVLLASASPEAVALYRLSSERALAITAMTVGAVKAEPGENN